ncbi:INO80 complex subunit B isoform X1 [Anopheles aquasalis]|uniref:INO80 complex subunit B isoform X1 n=1 Tax=Anopheles aquasalis TaxID=42839 RepID=UPI00215B6454|nr:INO80 complex subunit B isoform X1 [Anopheles aquasalis]
MGKKRGSHTDKNEDEDPPEAAQRRHKKHKKHKKSKAQTAKELEYDAFDEEQTLGEPLEVGEEIEYMDADPEPEIIAELETRSELQADNTVDTSVSQPLSDSQHELPSKMLTPEKGLAGQKGQKKKRTRGRDSGTSSEEERWLDAIESGKLEEVDDELKKIKPKDPKLMTARQRAMYERSTDKDAAPGSELLMSLPTGYKEKVMTAEAIQKAQLKSQKRKQMADEKREKDKKKTMERLLKKQDSKSVKAIKNRPVKQKVPMITYINGANGATISLPPDINFPLEAQPPRDPPKPVLCAIPNCTNIKRYNCSKTNIPLCSFECYKRNVEAIKKIIF